MEKSNGTGRKSAGVASPWKLPGPETKAVAGEVTPWHRDPFHRVTVVDLLKIEFRDGGQAQTWKITVGEVDWSEPSDRVHRARNVGKEVFEEVATFFLDRPDAVAQPGDDPK